MNFIVVPWTNIGIDAAALYVLALALAAHELGNVLDVDVFCQGGHVVRTNDLDLSSRLLVHEAFHNGPDAAEQHGCVANEDVAHDLRVVVGADLRR